MANSTGMKASGGGTLSDWDHVKQSIGKILMTPIGSRVMRRDFGSELFDLIDQRMFQKNVLRVYSAAASAIDKWEPRFGMTAGSCRRAEATGLLQLDIFGTYYPRGHLGDYSVAENASTRIVFAETV